MACVMKFFEPFTFQPPFDRIAVVRVPEASEPACDSVSCSAARAYSRNPEFYSFYRSLQAYDRAIGREGDILVVTPEGEFFKYLKDPATQR